MKNIGSKFTLGDLVVSAYPEGFTIQVGSLVLGLKEEHVKALVGWFNDSLGDESKQPDCDREFRLWKHAQATINVVHSIDHLRGDDRLIVTLKDVLRFSDGSRGDEVHVWRDERHGHKNAKAIVQFIEWFDELLPIPEIKETHRSYAFTLWVNPNRLNQYD